MNKVTMEDVEEFIRVQHCKNVVEMREDIKCRLKELSRKWLAETGIHDKDYKDIAPFDAGKRECAKALQNWVDNCL